MASLQSVTQLAMGLHEPNVAQNLDALEAQLQGIIEECNELLLQVKEVRQRQEPQRLGSAYLINGVWSN